MTEKMHYDAQDLRAIENCPESLKPLAELQYRGQMFSQVNAKMAAWAST